MGEATPEITITRELADGRGRYVAHVDGEEAELTFKIDDTQGAPRIVAKHTGVPDALSGLGVGKALVQRLVEDAREMNAYVVPLCSFVKTMLERHRDWQDVRDPDYS